MNESINGWKDEWMNEWMNERKDGWMNEWMNNWMNEWIKWINEWKDERMNEWMKDRNERMNKWMNEWMKSPNDSIGTGFPTGSNKFQSPRTPILNLKLRKWEKNKKQKHISSFLSFWRFLLLMFKIIFNFFRDTWKHFIL